MTNDTDILLAATPSFQKEQIEREPVMPNFPEIALQSNDPQRQSPIEVKVQPRNNGGSSTVSGNFTAIVAVNGLPYYALVNGSIQGAIPA